MIEIFAVGGYGEVGKNMTAIRVDDEVVIIDMGIHLPNYIKYTEEEIGDFQKASTENLIKVHAIPDDKKIDKLRKMVKAIIPSHAHLDHIGAVPYLASRFNAPIIGSPYTMSFLKRVLRDEKINLKNKLVSVNVNSTYKVSKNITAEFIGITHSIPHTCFIALHTKYGVILYSLDFKFDNHPVVGLKPNRAALERIGKKGVIIAMIDCLYANDHRKMPSESVVKEMLRDVMLGVNTKGQALIVTTFASHIARLKTIIEFGRKLNRKIVFLGRSLAKYTFAAEDVDLVNFSDHVKIGRYASQSRRLLKTIEKEGPDKYLLVVTGHQGEPKSTLSKMTTKELPFCFMNGDVVIFSCNVIPHPINHRNREQLEKSLRKLGVRIFKDIHVSGHPAQEDLRELFILTKPQHVIPAHAEIDRMEAFRDFAETLGYKRNKNIHFLKTGEKWSWTGKP